MLEDIAERMPFNLVGKRLRSSSIGFYAILTRGGGMGEKLRSRKQDYMKHFLMTHGITKLLKQKRT